MFNMMLLRPSVEFEIMIPFPTGNARGIEMEEEEGEEEDSRNASPSFLSAVLPDDILG